MRTQLTKITLAATFLAQLLFAASAMAQGTFYFLPPNDPDWIRKTPHILDMDAGTMRKMDLEYTACGWYRTAITSAEASHNIVIWQGKGKIDATTDRIGLLGLDEGEADWTGAPLMPTFIRFGELFTSLGASTIYFDPSKGIGGWGITNVMNNDQRNRCNYTMAGIIYDTDSSKLNSFMVSATEGSTGIRKGIPQPTLRKDAKGVSKMQFNQGKNGWSQSDFEAAFTCTSGKNAMVCYDTPFQRDSKGLWTFDSDYLCNNGEVDLEKPLASRCASNQGNVYGFFPRALNEDRNPNTVVDANCTYAACGSCANTYKAESWVPLNSTISRTCYEYGLAGIGGNKSGCGSPFVEGQFANGDSPAIWDWGFSRPTLNNKNEYFCFETHAEFTYEKGQEFYFSGDDDIWVFINNNLVIDLGGAHLAAPGYVALDSIGISGSRWAGSSQVSGNNLKTAYEQLQEGKEYPLDIFFCDRMGINSNVRISTNMYISQKNGLFVQSGTGTTSTAQLCLQGGGCDVVAGTGGAQLKCGEGTAGFIEFYIINRRGEPESKQVLNLNTPECRAGSTAGDIVCYGGITVNMNNGTARVDKNKLLGLLGSWSLYAKVVDSKAAAMTPPPEDVKIASFSSAAVAVRMAWGTIREGSAGGKVILEPICQQNPVATTGEYVPICISAGEISGSNFLIDDVESVRNIPFSLNTAGFTNNVGGKLKIYESNENMNGPNMGKPIAFTDILKTSYNGVLVLWVTGDYEQGELEFDYVINVKGRSDNPVTLCSVVDMTPIRLPRIASGGNILVNTIGNAIVLQNLPRGAKAAVYNLQGKLVYFAHPENPQILRNKDNRHLVEHLTTDGSTALVILVQTKGMYIVKISFGSETKMLRMVVR